MGGGNEYNKIMSDEGLVQIYVTTLNDLQEDFKKAAAVDIHYMPPMIKTTLGTMSDKTNFKKIDANGKIDNGIYAAREAYKANGVPFRWGPKHLVDFCAAAGRKPSKTFAAVCDGGRKPSN